MFSCVILRVPEPSGHYDLQIYALFPTCATAPKPPHRRPPRLASPSPPAPQGFTNNCNGENASPPLAVSPLPCRKSAECLPPSKNVFFEKNRFFPIYLFPPFGIYTQTPPPKMPPSKTKETIKSTKNNKIQLK